MNVLQKFCFPTIIIWIFNIVKTHFLFPTPNMNASYFAGASSRYLICLLETPAMDLCGLPDSVN